MTHEAVFVLLFAIAAALDPRDLLTMGDEPRAGAAPGELLVEQREVGSPLARGHASLVSAA